MLSRLGALCLCGIAAWGLVGGLPVSADTSTQPPPVVEGSSADGWVQGFAQRSTESTNSAAASTSSSTSLPAWQSAYREATARTVWTDVEWAAAMRGIPECWATGGVMSAECVRPDPTTTNDPANPPRPPRVLIESYVRTLIVRLQLPEAAPRVGPDPSVNEWGLAVVGYPLWLWTDGPRTLSTSASDFGITFDLSARHDRTTFVMGDGITVTCATTTAYPATITPGTPSPTCGYTYQRASRPSGDYQVTATTHWTISWAAAGYTGTLPMTLTGTRALPVGELQAVVVR